MFDCCYRAVIGFMLSMLAHSAQSAQIAFRLGNHSPVLAG